MKKVSKIGAFVSSILLSVGLIQGASITNAMADEPIPVNVTYLNSFNASSGPVSSSFSSDGSEFAVSNYFSNNVNIFSVKENGSLISKQIITDRVATPRPVRYAPSVGTPQTLFVGNFDGSSEVSVYYKNSSDQWAFDQTISGVTAHDITFSPDGSIIAIADFSANIVRLYTFSPIVGATSSPRSQITPLATIPVGSQPTSVKFSPDGRVLVIDCQNDASTRFYQVDVDNYTVQQIFTYGTGVGNRWSAISPDGRQVATVNPSTNKMFIFDIGTPTSSDRTITYRSVLNTGANTNPYEVVYSPNGDFIITSNHGTNNISIYDVDQNMNVSFKQFISVGATPESMSISPNGRFLTIANFGSGQISIFSINYVPSPVKNIVVELGDEDSNGNTPGTVTWDPPEDTGGTDVTDYDVTLQNDEGTVSKNVPGDQTQTNFDDVPGGNNLQVTVTANNEVGGSKATIPDAPTNVKGTSDDGKITVSWSPANNNGSIITKYTVTSSPEGKICETTGATSCTVEGLTNGVGYSFVVKAKNAVGDSADSVPSAIVKPYGRPDAPVNAQEIRNDSTITLSWDEPINTGGGITYYEITGTGLGTVTTTSTSYIFSDLDDTATYNFSIQAFNDAFGSPLTWVKSRSEFSGTDFDNGQVNVSIESSIGLVMEDDSVHLMDIPGVQNVTEDDNRMTYKVFTNNTNGYNVGMVADTPTLKSFSNPSNVDSIPVSRIKVDQVDSGSGTVLTPITLRSNSPKLVYNKNARSAQLGDSFTSEFTVTEMPFVNADDYTGTITYTATVN